MLGPDPTAGKPVLGASHGWPGEWTYVWAAARPYTWAVELRQGEAAEGSSPECSYAAA